MVRTLIYYDDLPELEPVANTLSMLLGPALPKPLNSNCSDVSDAVICCLLLVPGSKRDGRDLSYLIPRDLPVAVFVLDGPGAMECCDQAAKTYKSRLINAEIIPATGPKMIDRVIALRRRMMYLITDMPAEELRGLIDEMLVSHSTCTLCTGHANEVRATPIEYLYDNMRLYLFSEGGEKFGHLLQNPRVSVAVSEPYTSMQSLFGLQMTGTAAIIPLWSEEYLAVLAKKGLIKEKVRNLPVRMHMIRVTVDEVEVISSTAREKGYAVRQRYLVC
jgi:hypothetical protein